MRRIQTSEPLRHSRRPVTDNCVVTECFRAAGVSKRSSSILLLAALTLNAQEEPATIRTTTSEVLVDVVVRDKKGKLVHGLSTADFTVSEDGRPQQILSLREVTGDEAAAAPKPAPGQPAAPPPRLDHEKQVRLFTLVFDRLALESRRLARQAANDLIKEALPPNVYFAVFHTDLKLTVVQPFTNDRAKLKSAIERATGAAPTNYAGAAGDFRKSMATTVGSEGSAASAGRGGADGGGMAAEAMGAMVQAALDFAENSMREQSGRSSIFGLWGVVKEQIRLPGRKTLLYFSEGLPLPNAVLGQFRSMVSAANRANVAIYSVDARGLATEGDNQAVRDLLGRNLEMSSRNYSGTLSGERVSRDQMMQSDTLQDALRANPQTALAELAESTGGFLIANTNDFRRPLQRLTEELSSYYELVYRPANVAIDGRFRTIGVKLSQADVKVQSRSGYFALPSLGAGQNVYPFEVALLNALAAKPLPRGVDFRSTVLRFRPDANGAIQGVIVFDLPMKDLTFRQNEAKTAYRTHFSMLALLKDEQGEVVGKVSRDLPMDEPADKLAGFQQGRAIFTKQVTLRPGRYTLESAVADREGQRIAARRAAVVVPARPANAVALSGLALIRRVEKITAPPEDGDPFFVSPDRIVPTLADSVPGGAGKALSLYFVIFPAAGVAGKPTLTMEFFDGETRLGGGNPELPAPDASGRIPYIATTPLDGFKPGQYEVRVTARQGEASDRQSIYITVE
jgi:VWFA-related protein